MIKIKLSVSKLRETAFLEGGGGGHYQKYIRRSNEHFVVVDGQEKHCSFYFPHIYLNDSDGHGYQNVHPTLSTRCIRWCHHKSHM